MNTDFVEHTHKIVNRLQQQSEQTKRDWQDLISERFFREHMDTYPETANRYAITLDDLLQLLDCSQREITQLVGNDVSFPQGDGMGERERGHTDFQNLLNQKLRDNQR